MMLPHKRRKVWKWKCDSKGCEEMAQWYRRQKGKIMKLCTKHEAQLAKMHWGRRVDESRLTEKDRLNLRRKEWKRESAKRRPFETILFFQEAGIKVKIKDRRTDEWRSFVVGKDELERLHEVEIKLGQRGVLPKLSIDDYVKRLQDSLARALS